MKYMTNKKFEYKVIDIIFLDNLLRDLNYEGKQGWELIQIIEDKTYNINKAILKREYFEQKQSKDL